MTETTPTAGPSAAPNPIAKIIGAPIAAKPRAEEMLANARSYPQLLTNSVMVGSATQLVKMLRDHRKVLESERLLISGPINQGLKQLKARFDATTDPMKKAEQWLNDKITAFQTEQDRLARVAEAEAIKKQEEVAIEQAAKLEDSGDTEAAEEALEYATDLPAPVVAEEKIIRGQYGAGASLRTTWNHEVEDFSKVLRKFLMVNDAAVKEAIKLAPKGKDKEPLINIPGIKMVSTKQSVIR